jgi:hypothetical protein
MTKRESTASVLSAPRIWFSNTCRRGGWLLLIGLLFGGGEAARGADAEVSKEYQIKAAILYNFLKFVEWPRESFAEAASPIVIGVLGENPFGGELEKLVLGRKVNGRDIVVKRISSVAEASSVQLLFVTVFDDSARSILRTSGVLTVGESAQFAAGGGIINFTLVEDKVRFEINLAGGEQAGLKISSQLLKLATVVRRKL